MIDRKQEKTQSEKDAELNQIIKIKSFFGSGGWIDFKQRINDLISATDGKLMPLLFDNKPLSKTEFDEVNFLKAKRRAFLEVLYLESEMIGEVDPDYDADQLEKTGFDVKKPDAVNSPSVA